MGFFNLFKKTHKPEQAVSQELLEIQAKASEEIAKAQQFWRDFLIEKDRLLNLDKKDLVEQGCKMVNRYFEGVVVEFEQGLDEKNSRLVFSANGIVERFNSLNLLIKYAPEIQGLTVSAFRQRVDARRDFQIGMDGFHLKAQDILMKLTPCKGRVEAAMAFSKEIEPKFYEKAQNISLIVMDHVLGEYDGAIKIAGINFEKNAVPKDEVTQWLVLPDVPQVLDRLWTDELKHTQIFPTGEQQWLSFELRKESDNEDVTIGMFNQSANAIACRADMGVRLDVTIDVPDKETLNQIYEYVDALNNQLMGVQMGIHVLTLFSLQAQKRTMTYYVFDEQDALEQAIKISQRFPELQCAYQTEYDYRWNGYLRWLPN